MRCRLGGNMNKGFAYYFRKAIKTAVQTIFKNKNILQSMLYFFTSLIARSTVLLAAMPALADVRQAKIAQNERIIDVPQSFTNASRRPFWTMTVAFVLEVFIYLGGLMLVSVVCGLIAAIGLAVGQLVPSASGTISIIFYVPCLIIYLVYTIIVIAIFTPTAYVVDTNPELSAGEVVSVCVNSMKNRGKFTVFMCVFIPSLIMAVIAGALGAGFYFVSTYMQGKEFLLLVEVLLAIVSAVVLALTVPIFTLTMSVSLVLLFEDIALDPVNASKRTSGINIKRISGAKVDREEVATNLNALFDPSIEERKPEEEQLVHRHKKKERKSAETAPEAVPQAVPQMDEDISFGEVDDYADELPKPSEQTANATQQTPVQQAQPTPSHVPEHTAPAPQSAPEHTAPASQSASEHTTPTPQSAPVHTAPTPQSASEQHAQPTSQPVTGQPMAGQHPGQPMPGQPMAGQHPGQPMPGQPMAGQRPGQPMPGQPMPGQRPGQPMPGQPPVPPRPPQGNGANGNS